MSHLFLSSENMENKLSHKKYTKRLTPTWYFYVCCFLRGHAPEKVVQVCPAVKTSFSHLSCHSLDPQLQYDSVYLDHGTVFLLPMLDPHF